MPLGIILSESLGDFALTNASLYQAMKLYVLSFWQFLIWLARTGPVVGCAIRFNSAPWGARKVAPSQLKWLNEIGLE